MTACSTEGVSGQPKTENLSQKKTLKIKIKQIEFKIKPFKHEKHTESGYCYVVMFSLNFLNAEVGKTSSKRHLNINATRLI